MLDDFIVEVNDMDECDFPFTDDHASSLFMLIGVVLSACSQLLFSVISTASSAYLTQLRS